MTGAPTDKQTIRQALKGLIKANAPIIVLSLAVITFLAILTQIRNGDISQLDSLAYQFAVIKLRRGWLTPIMEWFSALSSPVVLLAIVIIISAFAPGKWPGWCVLTNLVMVVALNQVLKFIVQRPRPDGFRLIAESGYSFPSGHSMVSMAFYGLLAYLAWHYEPNRRKRTSYLVVFSVFILMVGVSRVYLGVHYASDVIAGFAISLVWLMFYSQVIAPIFLPSLLERSSHAGGASRKEISDELAAVELASQQVDLIADAENGPSDLTFEEPELNASYPSQTPMNQEL